MDTAAPSGKFCRAIPITNMIALVVVAFGTVPTEPKETPKESPSGILCNVIAVTNNILLVSVFLVILLTPPRGVSYI